MLKISALSGSGAADDDVEIANVFQRGVDHRPALSHGRDAVGVRASPLAARPTLNVGHDSASTVTDVDRRRCPWSSRNAGGGRPGCRERRQRSRPCRRAGVIAALNTTISHRRLLRRNPERADDLTMTEEMGLPSWPST